MASQGKWGVVYGEGEFSELIKVENVRRYGREMRTEAVTTEVQINEGAVHRYRLRQGEAWEGGGL